MEAFSFDLLTADNIYWKKGEFTLNGIDWKKNQHPTDAIQINLHTADDI